MTKRKRRSGGSKPSPKRQQNKNLTSASQEANGSLPVGSERGSVLSTPASAARCSIPQTDTNVSQLDGFGGPRDFSQENNRSSSPVLEVKVKLPPIMVKHVPLEKLMKALKALEIQAEYKICRIGIKVVVHTKREFSKATTYMKASRLEFFTHDIAMEKPFKVVLRGLPEMQVEDIASELRSHYKLNPSGVFQMKRGGNNQIYHNALYLVHFTKGTISLSALQAIRSIGSIIVRWEAYRGGNRDVTQCQRCLNFGHGTRNCHVKPRCGNCAQAHATADCIMEDTAKFKCANCKGDHRGSDRSCPKRNEFKAIRKQAATRSQPGRRSNPTLTPSDFPPLPTSQGGYSNAPLLNGVEQVTSNSIPAPRLNPALQTQNADPWATRANQQLPPKFSAEQLMEIFTEMCSNLQQCQTRQQQIHVLGLMVIRYGC